MWPESRYSYVSQDWLSRIECQNIIKYVCVFCLFYLDTQFHCFHYCLQCPHPPVPPSRRVLILQGPHLAVPMSSSARVLQCPHPAVPLSCNAGCWDSACFL